LNIKDLQNENKELRRKLSIAKNWMEREVKTQIQNISKDKVKSIASSDKNSFFSENIEDMVTNTVTSFFGELMLLNTPQVVIENIISAEILFYNFRMNKKTDGLWVITSYHKSIDILIESTITKGFRKFAKKAWQTQLRKNDPLEKTLNLVVNKWYILWIWKLFHIVSNIINNKELFDYWKCFEEYINKSYFIKDILLDKDFYKIFEELVELEILWKKRHIWKIWFEDTKKSRYILIWDLKDKNSIIYKLIQMGQPDF